MSARLARILSRLFTSALVLFLLGQPFVALAFDQAAGMSCCKNACCCRKSHGHTDGPALTSRDCGGQCHVSIRNTQPVAANIGHEQSSAQPAPAFIPETAYKAWLPCARPNPVLFERPPPSVA